MAHTTVIQKGRLYQIEFFHETDEHAHNAYLMIHKDARILIGLCKKGDFDVLKKEIDNIIDFDSLTHVVLPTLAMPYATALSSLSDEADPPLIVTSQTHRETIEHLETGLEYLCFEEHNHAIKLDQDTKLRFIKTPFINHPGDFVIYDETSRSLFSGWLFSHEKGADDKRLESIRQFAEHHVPSTDFLKPVLKSIHPLTIKRVLPLKGATLSQDVYRDAYATLSRSNFYNSSYLVASSKKNRRTYDYAALCEQAIKRLQAFSSVEEILKVFEDSDIAIDPDTLEVSSPHKGRTLWNRFFDIIHEKKGERWLIHLDAFIKRMRRMYNIETPSVFRSTIHKAEKRLREKEEESESLKEELNILQQTLENTEDKVLRDPVTGLYNERFFREFMERKDVQECFDEEKDHGVLFINVDQLSSINRDYGINAGNDTIKTVAYLIEQILDNNELAFKHSGALFLVYVPDVTLKIMQERANKIRNAVAASDLFIEKVTVSISIVTCREIDAELPQTQRLGNLFDHGFARINIAKQKGTGRIIDRTNDEEAFVEGYILLIDEDEINQNLIERFFRRENFKVITTPDVYEALDIIDTYTIEMIISEINLAKLDGFALKQKLNEHYNRGQIPYVMASHNKNEQTIRRANQLGVDLILEKPIYPEELLGFIRRQKARRHRQ